MTRLVEIHTDGACRGNPGPGGWAAVLYDPARNATTEISGQSNGNTTNMQMEMRAAIEGLAKVKVGATIVLYSDNQVVVRGFNEWRHQWERSGWRNNGNKSIKNLDLWLALAEAAGRHASVRFEWIKGHAGDPRNERADALARAQADEAGRRMRIATPTTMAQLPGVPK